VTSFSTLPSIAAIDPVPDLFEVERELAERSLIEFTEQAWHLIEPRTPFINSWHIGFLAEHLEAISAGELGDTLINVPPGTMKSILVSVMWPSWEWIHCPEKRFLCGSYDESLAVRDSLRMRTIIKSPWYQARWPLPMRHDIDMKTRYENEKTGWRMATSVGGPGTGEHPHYKIIDDPHNVKRSLSALSRREAITWFDLTLGSRGITLDAVTVVIMQRLHEDDLSGHILRQLRERYTFICLPMRYEPPAVVDGVLAPRMSPTPLGRTDPREKPGELLCPDLFPLPRVEKMEAQLRATMGEFGVSGQCQQRPIPESGGLFKEAWLPVIDVMLAESQIVARARGWDCAGTEGAGDYSVGVLLALTRGGLIIIEDVVRGQWGSDEFEGDTGIFRSTVVSDGRKVRQREEQEPGSAGKKVIAAHAKLLHGYPYTGAPSTGDKVTRARPFKSQASVGNVRVLRAPWNRDYIRELCGFPNSTYDDQVDGTSAGYDELTSDTKEAPSECTW
jgi:predicted phage terminase large subunit-like protein